MVNTFVSVLHGSLQVRSYAMGESGRATLTSKCKIGLDTSDFDVQVKSHLDFFFCAALFTVVLECRQRSARTMLTQFPSFSGIFIFVVMYLFAVYISGSPPPSSRGAPCCFGQ